MGDKAKVAFFKEWWEAASSHAPCLKECYERDLLSWKTPCGGDP